VSEEGGGEIILESVTKGRIVSHFCVKWEFVPGIPQLHSHNADFGLFVMHSQLSVSVDDFIDFFMPPELFVSLK
jgi:hypothetical protein